jgi:hypothetical protein
MALALAQLKNVSKPDKPVIKVMFNPETYTIVRNMNYPEIPVPGLRTPLLQFLRGDAETLSVDLLLDQSDSGEDLTGKLDELRDFVRIDKDLHAPPVCEFVWGKTTFPGVMTEFQEKFLMFSEKGDILRVRVSVKMKAYEPALWQKMEANPLSPDRTKTRTVRQGDRYDSIAAEEYGDPALWPVLAAANGSDRPRLLKAGDLLRIPPL